MCVFVWGLDDRDLFFIIMWRLKIERGKESVCVCVCVWRGILFFITWKKNKTIKTQQIWYLYKLLTQTYLAKDIPTLNNGETDY